MQNEYWLAMYDRPVSELATRADRARHEAAGNHIELCSIVNARSGRCGEDCKFCAQSVHYQTGAEEFGLLSREALIAGARQAKEIGSHRFGIVTSGNRFNDADVEVLAGHIAAIRAEVDIPLDASLGCLSLVQLTVLRQAGLSRYHHNLETSRRFYPQIVSTHSYDDRIDTVRAASDAGLSVCCGGIIGMGETREDRIDMAITLKKLQVDAIPINILMPIPGTPLEGITPISPVEVLKTLAIFRLMMPDRGIKLAAGRETVLKDYQGSAFLGGANGMIIGGYLTQRGRAVEEDHRLVEEVLGAWNT